MQTPCALATVVEQLASVQHCPATMQPEPHFVYPPLHMNVQLLTLHSGVALGTVVEQSLLKQHCPEPMHTEPHFV